VAHAGLMDQPLPWLTESTSSARESGHKPTCQFRMFLIAVMLALATAAMPFQFSSMPMIAAFRTKRATTTRLLIKSATFSINAEHALSSATATRSQTTPDGRLVITGRCQLVRQLEMPSRQSF